MIKLENISYKTDGKKLLDDITIDFLNGCWAITGANGSGKSILAMIIAGILKPYSGTLVSDEKVGYASFELQQKIMTEERKKDNSRFMHGSVDPGTLVKDFLTQDSESFSNTLFEKYKLMFGLERIMERGLRFLSTGEFRKVLLCKALSSGPDALIIDDPFDGLDPVARENLNNLIMDLIKSKERIFIVTSRHNEIPNCIENVLSLNEGKIAYAGSIHSDDYLKILQIGKGKISVNLSDNINKDIFHSSGLTEEKSIKLPDNLPHQQKEHVILMKNVSVAYDGIKIISNINWDVRKGERWKITGPNGSGKSTLMSLINGDNPKAYLNNISLFGKKRESGSGESIWDIKKRIGFVSGDLQMNFRIRTNVLDTVLSGFFDSIGLYNNVSGLQMEEALKWLKAASLVVKKNIMFEELSYGEKRLVLIIRAFIKKPELLILDEPCQGLDEENTMSVINLINMISENNDTTIIFITHDTSLLPKGFDKHLSFCQYAEGGYTASSV
ncbi:MAG: ATP-binding cassette domain-containing protein [Spirochaetaceae bacterium]|nr:ATP-binding cassette domain-containing protein [Spirochaetaceae bacterium]